MAMQRWRYPDDWEERARLVKEAATLRRHWGKAHSVAVSPDGRALASGSDRNDVAL